MYSYSDCVLASQPWGYWCLNAPLGDPSLVPDFGGIYYTLIDSSGNNRHMYCFGSDQWSTITYNNESFNLTDAVPISGMRINNTYVVSPEFGFPNTRSYNAGSIFLFPPVGSHEHNVTPEDGNVIRTQPIRKARIEFLCADVENIYLFFCGVAIFGGNIYYKTTVKYTTDNVIWKTNLGVAHLIAAVVPTNRMVVEIEYKDDRNVIISVCTHDSFNVDHVLVTLPLFDDLPENSDILQQYSRFVPDDLDKLILFNGIFANISVHYNRELLEEYLAMSWDALNSDYTPNSYNMLGKIYNEYDGFELLSALPNSLLATLDATLIKGGSHRFSQAIEVSTIENRRH